MYCYTVYLYIIYIYRYIIMYIALFDLLLLLVSLFVCLLLLFCFFLLLEVAAFRLNRMDFVFSCGKEGWSNQWLVTGLVWFGFRAASAVIMARI